MKRVPTMGLKGQVILKIWVEMISFKIRFPDLSKANTSYAKTGNSTLLSNEENTRKHKKLFYISILHFSGYDCFPFQCGYVQINTDTKIEELNDTMKP